MDGWYNPPSSGGATGVAAGVLSGTYPNPGFAAGPTFIGPLAITGGANANVLTTAGQSLTGADQHSMVDLAGAWNTTGLPTLIKANVTDTSSPSGALLIDLQTNTTSRFKVSRAGIVTSASDMISGGNMAAAAGSYQGWASRSRVLSPSNGVIQLTNTAQTDFTRLQFGLTTNAAPALKRNAAILEVKLADDSAFTQLSADTTKVVVKTVATLPAAASNAGAVSQVSDASTTLVLGLGSTVVGGGANFAPVWSDGTNWRYG